MAYEQKPGTGSIFKNQNKKEARHPDYKGLFKDVDGKEWSVALWVKEGQKGKFFSMGMSEPQPQQKSNPQVDNGNDLPF